MSRGATKSGGKRLRGGAPKRRPSQERRPNRTVLIQCEGEQTEPSYFRAIKKKYGNPRGRHITIKRGKGRSPEDVVESAIIQKEKGIFDEVWAVVDIEGTEQKNNYPNARVLAREHDILMCHSIPCFEVWYLAHFEETSRPFTCGSAVIDALNKHWQNHHNGSYDKTSGDHFERLEPRTQDALRNAKRVRRSHEQDNRTKIDANSMTEVDMLVRIILGK